MDATNPAAPAGFAFWAKWRGEKWKVMAQGPSRDDVQTMGGTRVADTRRHDDPNPRTMILPMGEHPPDDPPAEAQAPERREVQAPVQAEPPPIVSPAPSPADRPAVVKPDPTKRELASARQKIKDLEGQLEDK